MLKVAQTLYHGTTYENAKVLLTDGWIPDQVPAGTNNGQPDCLYLSTDRVDAAFYGYMNDEHENVVLAVTNVPLSALAIDPEDSQRSTVEEELSGATNFPGRFVLRQAIPASHFSLLDDSA